MKKIILPISISWQRLAYMIFSIVVSLLLLLINLTSVAPRLSPTEKTTMALSSSWHLILINPLNWPFKILEKLAQLVWPTNHLLAARIPSVLLALVSLVIFGYIIRKWYGRRLKIFGFSLIVASAWFLHIGRFGGFDIIDFVGILSLLAVYTGLSDLKSRFRLYIWLVTNLVLLFIPGFVWFVFLGALWQVSQLKLAWQEIKILWQRLILVLIGLIGFFGLGFSLYRHKTLILPWLGLAQSSVFNLTFFDHLGKTLLAFVYQAPSQPQLWLGQIPILDVLMMVLVLTGFIFYGQHWQAQRTRLLLSELLSAIILVSLGGPVGLSAIVPIVFIIMVAGLAYLLHFWLKVYPLNGIARAFGITLISLAIGLSCFYNMQQYFVAWPNNPQTIQIYRPSSP